MIYKLINNEKEILKTPTDSFDFDNPIVEPKEFDFNHCHDFLYENGFTIYPGKVNHSNTFRIANIGDIRPADIELFLRFLESYLNDSNI